MNTVPKPLLACMSRATISAVSLMLILAGCDATTPSHTSTTEKPELAIDRANLMRRFMGRQQFAPMVDKVPTRTLGVKTSSASSAARLVDTRFPRCSRSTAQSCPLILGFRSKAEAKRVASELNRANAVRASDAWLTLVMVLPPQPPSNLKRRYEAALTVGLV